MMALDTADHTFNTVMVKAPIVLKGFRAEGIYHPSTPKSLQDYGSFEHHIM